jgi:hypothetical protein
VVATEVGVLCPYCHAQVHAPEPARVRQLLLVDRGSAAEARALLEQNLACRFETPTAVVDSGRDRLLPFWSVVTADGELLTGPATREESTLLHGMSLPSLPARPLDPDEPLLPEAGAVDVSLPEFLAQRRVAPGRPPAGGQESTASATRSAAAGAAVGAAGAPAAGPARIEPSAVPESTLSGLDRAWLLWVPVRLWQVRVGWHRYRAVTIADCTTPLVDPILPADATPRLERAILLPLAAWAAGMIGLGCLLPLPLHAGIAAALTAAFLLLWRPGPATVDHVARRRP